jgi:acyl carrier protein
MGLQVVEIILELEERFSVCIPDDVAGNCVTVGDMQCAIVDLLAADRGCEPAVLMQEVFDGIVSVVSEQTGISPANISADSSWIGDITRYG